MQITEALIRRFLSGEVCSPQETELVSQYLRDHPELVLDLLRADWEEAGYDGELAEGLSVEMLNNISERTYGGHSIRRMARRFAPWTAAAIIILLAAFGLMKTNLKSRALVAGDIAGHGSIRTTHDAQWKMKLNHSAGRERIQLADGSVVSLFPQAILRYQDSFVSGRRQVFLEGEASFEIAKDKSHPFIVMAGNTVTTVLGTAFNILENNSGVRVKLFNGKVSIHAAERDYLLSPGEQMNYENDNGQVNLSPFARHESDMAGLVKQSQAVDKDALVFENTALPEVMEKLADRYHTIIHYDQVTIGKMYFSGTVLTTDSLATILRVIGNMNSLSIIPEQKGFTITPNP